MLAIKKCGDSPGPRAAGDVGRRNDRARMLSGAQRLWRCTAALILLCVIGCDPPGRSELISGNRLIRQGRSAEAVEPLKRAVTLLGANAPAAAQALNYLGLAYHHAGRNAEAVQAYQTALKLDFNLSAARYNLGCALLDQPNLAGALNEFLTYTSHRPNDYRGWLRLGTAQYRARLFEAAEKSLRKTVELNAPNADCAEAMNLIGMCQAARRRPQDALKSLQVALRFQTNYAPALLNQAIVAQTHGDRVLAAEKYKTYLDAIGGPTNHPAVAALLSQLEASQRPRIAETNKIVTLPPTNLLAQAIAPRTNAIAPTTPPATRTNIPAVATSTSKPPIPVVGTHSNLTTAAATTNSRPKEPQTPPQRSQARTAQAPSPTNEPPSTPLELVRLADEAPVRTAKEFSSPPRENPPARPIAPSIPAGTVTNTAAPSVVVATLPQPLTPAPTEVRQAPPKRSWLQRLNPLNLVRSRDKATVGQPRAVAQTSPSPDRPTTIPAASGQRMSTPSAPATRTAPVFPRYKYSPTSMPVPGNRQEAERHFAAGLAAQKAGSTDQAIRGYQEAVAADPSYFEAYYNLGVAAHDAANWPLALKANESALVLKPGDGNARFNLALALEKTGYPADAANELETLLAGNPGNVAAHFANANIYARTLEDRTKARAHYARVLELDPRHPQAAAIRRWLSANRGP